MEDQVPEVPLAFISNAYLEKKIAQHRQKSILWEGYERANVINHSQVELIKALDKKPADQVQSTVQQNGEQCALLILHLLQNISRPDTVQYVCILADDILSGHEDNARYFHATAAQNSDYPFKPFFRAMHMDDEVTSLEASKVLTILSCSAPIPSSLDLSDLYKWITLQLASERMDIVDIAVQEVASLLRVRQFRLPFWKTHGAIKELVRRLEKSASPQMQYQVIFCLWLLTFEPEIASKLNEQYDVVPLLIDIAKAAVKEKVIRVAIATLKNLVELAPAENLAAMLVAKLLPFTENLAARKWSDADIVEDVEYVKERLQESFQSLTTFEQYASEVETGKLEWSPPHKSEAFWKENSSRLDENNYSLLRALARILSTSTNPTVLAIACNDIGQYTKYSSKVGKRVLQDIGAKQRVMELMTHEDQDVRYQALSAVQKYMHQAW
ncbi:ATPase V1 complex subunit H [Radiomyces spectabilis]|uniref:ATPase V1 complex subunit H n=1 Tax=Radiomyces spectabilis TaxID=64574 RepID=UPI00222005CF|nr:ATPase V1 complex subunit H [Radiomyces spectabilis]KAI8390886.1 ATPase V1 complex subunit H [Radiomyces spectabilis]